MKKPNPVPEDRLQRAGFAFSPDCLGRANLQKSFCGAFFKKRPFPLCRSFAIGCSSQGAVALRRNFRNATDRFVYKPFYRTFSPLARRKSTKKRNFLQKSWVFRAAFHEVIAGGGWWGNLLPHYMPIFSNSGLKLSYLHPLFSYDIVFYKKYRNKTKQWIIWSCQ